jgi:hypothetical protein
MSPSAALSSSWGPVVVLYTFSGMADLAQLNLASKGAEIRLRSLLEDVVQGHFGVYPQYRLALAVWFAKSGGNIQRLLELFSGPPSNQFATTRFSLLWKTGSEGPPLVEVSATSVDYFSQQLTSNPVALGPFFDNWEVLYFDKSLLPGNITSAFQIVTEPAHFLKGWYVEADRAKGKTIRDLLSSYETLKPDIGLVKTEESQDFENCRGLLHVEHNQIWVPISLNGLRIYTFYNELQQGKPGVFLFRGGSLYIPLKFEEKTAPEYSNLVLKRLPDDRYPEVYLRAKHPPEQSAA